MKLVFRNAAIRKLCTLPDEAQKKWGKTSAGMLHMYVAAFESAGSFDDIVALKIGDCHPLTGDLKGWYALKLEFPFRLLVTPLSIQDEDGSERDAIGILNKVDYHGKNGKKKIRAAVRSSPW